MEREEKEHEDFQNDLEELKDEAMKRARDQVSYVKHTVADEQNSQFEEASESSSSESSSESTEE